MECGKNIVDDVRLCMTSFFFFETSKRTIFCSSDSPVYTIREDMCVAVTHRAPQQNRDAYTRRGGVVGAFHVFCVVLIKQRKNNNNDKTGCNFFSLRKFFYVLRRAQNLIFTECFMEKVVFFFCFLFCEL